MEYSKQSKHSKKRRNSHKPLSYASGAANVTQKKPAKHSPKHAAPFKSAAMNKLAEIKNSENVISLLIFVLSPIYLEVMLHIFVYGGVSAKIVYPIIFAASFGLLLYFIAGLLPNIAARIVSNVLIGFTTLYFEVQFIYNSIFGEFMSLWQVSFGADAIANFWRAMLYGILRVLPKVFLLLVPFVIALIFTIRRKNILGHRNIMLSLTGAVGFILLHLIAIWIMTANNSGLSSVYSMYHSGDTTTEISVKNLGVITTSRLEATHILFGFEDEGEYTSSGDWTGDETVEYNMLNLDFDALLENAESDTLKKIDEYMATAQPTRQNEYTGMFKDYNLIALCCESYSPLLIDEELTPTLYKLAHGGFIFNNYFGSFESNTTNGEYTFCTGIFPDMSRQKSSASFYASRKNYLPFCYGNMFTDAGGEAWAYHDYSGSYYTRNQTHPNMGYTFKGATEIGMRLNWPASDLEMMEKSVDDYIASGKQFCAYYMTFSGHYQYNWANGMSYKNKSTVRNLPYSETVKAYIACNLELEKALTYLLQRLEEAGIADKTVIVLTNDHYPYGLESYEYNELAGRKIDTTFEKFRNSFICYTPNVNIEVDTYCSTVDILPTVLNLFGFEYDSRLLMGRDVLSEDAYDYAVLSDQSFVTKDYGFDASTGKIIKFTDAEVSEDDAAAIKKDIATRFRLSTDILNSDYYEHALNSGEGLKKYSFRDIPDTLSPEALEYAVESGYIMPVSDMEFGSDKPYTSGELMTALYNADGLGSANGNEILDWAQSAGLITKKEARTFDYSAPATLAETGAMLRMYAKHIGTDTSVSENYIIDYKASGVTLDEVSRLGLAWCSENSVIPGDRLTLYNSSASVVTRAQAAEILYSFHLKYEK